MAEFKRLTGWDKGSAYVRECFERNEAGGGCEDMDSLKCNRCEANLAVCSRLAKYEDSGLSPEQVAEMQAENTKIKKAFALACRCLAEYLDCPAVYGDADFPECSGEMDECGGNELGECWQRYFAEKSENEMVCSVCGCTWENACEGGCYWVEEDLCSQCDGKEAGKNNNTIV